MKSLTPALIALLPLGLATACSSSTADQEGATDASATAGPDGSTPDSTSDSGSSTGSDPSTGSTGSEDDEPDAKPPIRFDAGTIPDAPDETQGCRAVDFLFVIDNSGSMSGAQDNLTDNFPTFIAGIQSTLTEVDSYHVGVVTSDDYSPNTSECNQLGGLVVSTGGFNSSDDECGPFAEGDNFMTEMDDLGPAFECAADVGTSGNNSERPMEAMERAIDGTHAEPGECNAGFVRNDALLVVVLITDEADGPGDTDGPPPSSSEGDPASWYETVVASKLDRPENAAVLALVNPINGQNIIEFAELFGENGFVADIGEDDYGPAFEQAIGVVETACENFIAPG